VHDIEHQIIYPGSNFIFHDSPGFESGGNKEIEGVWKFIEKWSNTADPSEQLHAIWYLSLVSVNMLADHSFAGIVYPWTAPVPC
jgi:hypothetical protein